MVIRPLQVSTGAKQLLSPVPDPPSASQHVVPCGDAPPLKQRRAVDVEAWQSLRQSLYVPAIELECPPIKTSCTRCEMFLEGAELWRCGDCGPEIYYCCSCAVNVHKTPNTLHQLEIWEVIYIKIFVSHYSNTRIAVVHGDRGVSSQTYLLLCMMLILGWSVHTKTTSGFKVAMEKTGWT